MKNKKTILISALILFALSQNCSSIAQADTTTIREIASSGLPAKFSNDTVNTYPMVTGDETDQDTLAPWGMNEPGKGTRLFKTDYASMNIVIYGLLRYMNQLPPKQTYLDHNGNPHNVDTRNDFQWHRSQLILKGFLYDPKLTYSMTVWGLNATDNINLVGTVTYEFWKELKLTGGIGALPGTRTEHSSHPLWLGTDRVMADEYFKPGFTSGIWISGEALPGFKYIAMLGNSLTQVGIKATQLTRDLAKSVSIWWMPTTHEFGPMEGFSDYEHHDNFATTFGASFTESREDRFSQIPDFPDNTVIRLSDGTLPFETGVFAPGVTVSALNYYMTSVNAGFKYKGFFLQTEFYYRVLNNFDADGTIPLNRVIDRGFYVQGSFYPIKKRLELYGGTSQIFGEFNYSNEYIVGVNVYPFPTRNFRLNGQANIVYKSPVSSAFGYYVGGLQGTILSSCATVYF